MVFLALLPHLYALFLIVAHPLEVAALRARLAGLSGSTQQSQDWIEHAVFQNILSDTVKAPLIALLPTVVRTLETGRYLLAGIVVFLFLVMWTVFRHLPAIWGPYHLNRTHTIVRLRIRGTHLIMLGEAGVVLLSAVVAVLA